MALWVDECGSLPPQALALEGWGELGRRTGSPSGKVHRPFALLAGCPVAFSSPPSGSSRLPASPLPSGGTAGAAPALDPCRSRTCGAVLRPPRGRPGGTRLPQPSWGLSPPALRRLRRLSALGPEAPAPPAFPGPARPRAGPRPHPPRTPRPPLPAPARLGSAPRPSPARRQAHARHSHTHSHTPRRCGVKGASCSPGAGPREAGELPPTAAPNPAAAAEETPATGLGGRAEPSGCQPASRQV